MLEETKEILLNKKNKENEEITECLNNIAPFKTIIGAIDQKRKKKKNLSNYLDCTVRRRHHPEEAFSLSDFLIPAQPRNAFSDDWDGGLNTGFFEEFSHKSFMPWMITKIKNIGQADPLTDTLRQRYAWNRKWTSFKCAYYKTKKKKYKWFDDDVLYCPKMFIDMAEHLENKPDPYFDHSYNWYYAGKGNMLVAQIDGLDYLIHSEFNCLNITPFFNDSLSVDMNNTTTYKCDEENNIMETIYSQSQNVIAIRNKCKVIILKVATSQGVLTLDRLKEMDSKLPFTSITFDEFHNNILYVTTLDYVLTIVNLDRMTGRTKKLRGKFTSLVDNWSSVIGAERGYYTHVTNKALTLYDKRTNEPFQRWKNFGFLADIQTCGKISAAKYCQRKPLLYVGTDHHLFLMDMRCGNTKDKNIKPVQRWSHGMMVTPTYIDICEVDHNINKEMVCLTSQWVEDMCLVSNYSDRLTRTGEIRGLTEPFRPPSIMQTFNEAQKKRLCCNLYEPIRHRLCTSISGLSIIPQGDNNIVLLQNSLGDISCHTLCPQHMFSFIEDDSTERLHEWSKDYKEKREPFEVSHVIDISMFLKRLYQVPNNFILGRNSAMKPRLKFNENEIYETYSKEDLDPEFLEIWKEKNEEVELDKTGMSQFFVDTS